MKPGSNKFAIAAIAAIATIALVIVAISSSVSQSDSNSDNQNEFEGLHIKLERTGCEGFCPAYSVELFGNGTVLFNGLDYTAVKGKQTSQVSQVQIKELVDKFNKVDFFGLQEAYDIYRFDVPITTTSISLEGKTKIVKHSNSPNVPEELLDLERKIEETAGTEK
jgi:hypothetical protein